MQDDYTVSKLQSYVYSSWFACKMQVWTATFFQFPRIKDTELRVWKPPKSGGEAEITLKKDKDPTVICKYTLVDH